MHSTLGAMHEYTSISIYSNQSAGVLAGINSAIKTRDGELLGEAGMTDADAFSAEIVTDATGTSLCKS